MTNEKTREEAIKALAVELKDYAEDYLERSWNNAPNRKHHYPIVLKVLLKDTINDILQIMEEVQ